MIPGGATIWARQTMDSEIFQKPDKWFKVWFYLVNQVNHKNNGRFKRGHGFITYRQIMDSTGATKDQVKHCIEYLKTRHMIATQKATRGMTVTIVNYNTYQDLNSYESHTKKEKKATQKPHRSHTINKNDKNDKNVQEKTGGVLFPKELDFPEFHKAWANWTAHRKEIKKKLTSRAIGMQLKMLVNNKIKAIAIIETSIQNGWTGLFPERNQNGSTTNTPPPTREPLY